MLRVADGDNTQNTERALYRRAAYNGRTSRTFGSSSYVHFRQQSEEDYPRGGKLTEAKRQRLSYLTAVLPL